MHSESGFEAKLLRGLRPYPSADRYLVGVSGGRDSVALLHGLLAAGFRRLIVCHLDHGLRGAASRADARFVGRLVVKHGLTLETARVDVAALARQEKLSLETAAREARHRFFAEVSGRRRCRNLFLAHQADDQVETFLFNLLRGSGPAGLAGMRAESERTVGRRKLALLRPLLAVWRSEIDDFLHENQLRWREDATNALPAHATRNRLRLEVLPGLAQAMGRDVRPALWRAADLLGAEEAWLQTLCAAQTPPPKTLELDELRAKPLAMQRRVVRRWLAAQNLPDVGYRDVEAVLSLLESRRPAKVNLPENRHARRRSGVLFVE